MSDLTRRGFIGTMAVAAGAFAMPRTMDGGDLPLQNKVADPLLAGKKLRSKGESQHYVSRARCAAYVATIPPKTLPAITSLTKW